MGALSDFKCAYDLTLVYVCYAGAEKCIFEWSFLSQTPQKTPQVTYDASRISAWIFWLSLKERKMLRRLDVFSLFWKVNDRSCHSQAEKKIQALSWKKMQMLQFLFLHGVEWDWLIVHRTHRHVHVEYKYPGGW